MNDFAIHMKQFVPSNEADLLARSEGYWYLIYMQIWNIALLFTCTLIASYLSGINKLSRLSMLGAVIFGVYPAVLLVTRNHNTQCVADVNTTFNIATTASCSPQPWVICAIFSACLILAGQFMKDKNEQT